MKKLITVILCISGLFLSLPTKGQDAKTAFKKVNEAFSKYNRISYNITYNYYKNGSDKKPYETLGGVYKKDGGSFYQKIDSREFIVNDNYQVIIDNETKHMVVENRPQVVKQEQFMIEMDSVLALCKSISSKKSGASDLYSLFFDTDVFSYSQLDITIDPAKNFITKIVFHLLEYDEDGAIINRPRLEVQITDYNTAPVFSPNLFTETKYVKIDKGGNVSLAKNYSTYTLLNNKVSIQ